MNEDYYVINDEFHLSKNEVDTNANEINLASMQYIEMDMKDKVKV